MPRAKKTNAFSRSLLKRKLLIWVLILAVASFGVIVALKLNPPFFSFASSKMVCTPPNGGACKFSPNPPLVACRGYDIAILGDMSASMSSVIETMKNDMRNLVNTMQNTNSQFAVGDLGPLDPISAFTGDVATTHSMIEHSGMYADEYRDYRIVNQMDKRPANQNLIILFTDVVNTLMPETSADLVKQSGTRIIIVRYITVDTWGDADDPEWTTVATYLAGPEAYTGSILNANIVFSRASTNNIANYATALAAQAKQPCSNPPTLPPPPCMVNCGDDDGGGDDTGDDDGGGGGDDTGGTGPNGDGAGGGGGGGSSATTQGDSSNATPSNTGQGDGDQPKIDPSPFFDGRLFAIGSDSDASIEKSKTVGIGGLRIGYGWFYVLGTLIVLGIGGWFGWKYRKQLRATLKTRFGS